jgi:tetratricopeptide (TPR) repeat protein
MSLASRITAWAAGVLVLLLFVAAALSLAALPAAATPAIERLMEAGHWKRARAEVEALARTRPDDARTWWLRSRVQAAFGDRPAAVASAERAVAADPSKAEYHWQLAEQLGEQASDAGPLKGLGLAKRFRKEAEQAMRLDPQHVDARYGMMLFYEKAPGLIGGDKKKAAAMAKEIAAIDPLQGLVAEARLAAERRDTTRVLRLRIEAVSRFPNDYRARIALANLLARPATLDEAWGHAGAASYIDSSRAAAWGLLAGIAAHRGQWPELESTLARAERNLPDNYTPHYQAARALVTTKKEAPRAEALLRRYLATPPEAGAPSHAGARWRLAQALEQQGKTPEAIAELQKAVAADPKLEGAQQDLKRLKKS